MDPGAEPELAAKVPGIGTLDALAVCVAAAADAPIASDQWKRSCTWYDVPAFRPVNVSEFSLYALESASEPSPMSVQPYGAVAGQPTVRDHLWR